LVPPRPRLRPSVRTALGATSSSSLGLSHKGIYRSSVSPPPALSFSQRCLIRLLPSHRVLLLTKQNSKPIAPTRFLTFCFDCTFQIEISTTVIPRPTLHLSLPWSTKSQSFSSDPSMPTCGYCPRINSTSAYGDRTFHSRSASALVADRHQRRACFGTLTSALVRVFSLRQIKGRSGS